MGKSKIEWTERVWNPVTGCTKVSQGCKHCYAERIYERFNGPGTFKNVTCHEDRLEIPLRIKKPSVFFVNSMSDLFHDDVPFAFIHKLFVVMALCPQHTFQILTKRAGRMVEYFNKYEYWGLGDSRDVYRDAMQFNHLLYSKTTHQMHEHLSKAGWLWDVTVSEFGKDSELIFEQEGPLPNVWIGVSVEDQKAADERIPLLLQVPAAVRWLSCEPLLGSVDLALYLHEREHKPENGIHWVVAGGESGPGARPMLPKWADKIRFCCEAFGVPFFFKQWGEWNEDGVRVGKTKAGRLLNGILYDIYPRQK